jgi:hypothetical protein
VFGVEVEQAFHFALNLWDVVWRKVI